MGTAKQNAINLYLHGIKEGRAREAVEAYTGARYTQHSTGVRDGKDGFIEFFEPFIERNPVRDIQITRAWQEGRQVFVQAYQSLNHGEAEWVTTDFFDSDEDGKIIEHWDVIGAFKGKNPSGRTQVDGPSEPTDLDKTAENKALVLEFINHCLIARNVADIPTYISADKYLQHNPDVADGLDHFLALFSPDDCPLRYSECFMAVASGDMVATLNRASFDGQDLCQCDIFRVEDGKIVEHWDNSEPVPPQSEWANGGKF